MASTNENEPGGRALLDAHQLAIVDRVLGEERREHLVVYLSGAHAYGFPSPDSDIDMKAIHIEPTRSLLGLRNPRATFDRAEILEGVEIDYTSNELGMLLGGLLSGNGNYLERVLGESTLGEHPLLAELRPLAARSLSRRYHHHYRGFATSQKHALAEKATAKRALYVLRTTLTGAHLMATGELVTDVRRLLAPYGFEEAHSLIEIKQRAERTELDPGEAARWTREIDRAFEVLDRAAASSPLPSETENADELEAWLLRVRLDRAQPGLKTNG